MNGAGHSFELNFRFADQADAGLILELVKELAAYEELSHEVVADEETLGASLFQGRRVAEVVIAECDGHPAGFALFFHNFSTFLGRAGLYLEDLYVRPQWRGKGVGKGLLSFLAAIALERGCGRMEWWVLDWNRQAIGFYEGLGAQAMDEWTVYRLTGEALARLASQGCAADGPAGSDPVEPA